MKRQLMAVAAALLVAGTSEWVPAAEVDASTMLQSEARRTDTLGARRGTEAVQTQIASEFSAFAGSEVNAQHLVSGLRSGTPITLSSTSTGTGGTPTTTLVRVDPPTRPMGHGNVFISLALAQQQLASYGINDPTPREIRAGLTGGTITTGSGATARTVTLRGILTQRADGQGWGAIAKSQGVKLGHVVSALKSANHQVEAGTTANASTGAMTGPGTPSSASATTHATAAAGTRSPNSHAGGAVSTGASGMVSAGGAGGGVDAGLGAGARANGAGIVTGVGAAARVGSGVPGLAKGHSKP